ncbi:hypothetical protein [uncultured Kordia sp.]|uniref:hypothetical protein n=1 Tax=uncultured Kordia sp. TaxID=507699 RepID=UPI002639A77D|nr:hypothetical protein [uncultured Kordia sp.]
MKPFLLAFIGFFCMLSVSAQETTVTENPFEKKLKEKQELVYTLIDDKEEFDRETAVLEVELAKLTDEEKIEEAKENIKNRKETSSEKNSDIINACKDYTKYREYVEEYEDISEEILNKYKARVCELYKEEKEELDPEKFIIVGDNDPVKADSLFSNASARQVLSNVFSIDSKTNLGTFEIPGDNSFITFYIKENTDFSELFAEKPYAVSIRQKKIEKGKEGEKEEETVAIESQQGLNFVHAIPEGALFKSIQIELREGGIVDTRLVLKSVDGKFEFYFEGVTPVSILNYTRKVKKSFLQYSHNVSLDGKGVYNENALKNLLVRYTDVLDYHPNAGSNYVPDDVSYTFPSKNDDDEAKETGRRSYQVINDNHLQHVLDLRTYTDLLGLFGDEANGLFQIEGRAEFFIHPFNVRREAFYYLKKITPYVRYSRLDEDNDFLQATMPDMDNPNPNPAEPDNFFFNDSKLDLLERSNLEMGVDMNVINFRLFKESPFWTSLYVPFSYNVTKVRTDASVDNNDANFKTLGLGVGLNFEIRRFNNFGLNFGYELKGYSFIGDYAEFNLSEPGYMRTQAVKAEIFYYPGLDKSNSIFLRMRSIRDISSGNGDSFFQLQVGYRFTLGVGAIKAR